MKLRLQKDSIRLRLSRSELTRFAENGCLEETVYFGGNDSSRFTYRLVSESRLDALRVESTANTMTVLLPGAESWAWTHSEQVGISADIDLDPNGVLSVLVEKDFACLDRSEAENADTFPNPLAAHAC